MSVDDDEARQCTHALHAGASADADASACAGAGVGADADADASWEALPAAVLQRILALLLPGKRGDVRAACRSWRCAVDASIDGVRLPAADLALLAALPNVSRVSVTGAPPAAAAAATGPCACRWPPCGGGSGGGIGGDLKRQQQQQQPLGDGDGMNGDDDNVWSAASGGRLLGRLQALSLVHCPAAVQQLARAVTRPTSAPTSAVGGLVALRSLALRHAGDVTAALPALLVQHDGGGGAAVAENGACNGGSSSSGSGGSSGGAPLRALGELRVVASGLTAVPAALPALPSLRVLELSGVRLRELPAAVLGCAALTALVVADNELVRLPAALGRCLPRLRLLDVSGNAPLQALGGGLPTGLVELRLAGPVGLWSDAAAVSNGGGGGAAPGGAAAAAAAGASSNASGGANGTSSGHSGGGGCGLSSVAARAALPPLLPPLPHAAQLGALDELSALSALTRLDVSGNRQLMVLPEVLPRLRAPLASLDARGCSVRYVGDELLGATGLRELLLADNVLAELPEGIAALAALTALDLGACGSLWRLPAALLALPALKRLVLPSRGVGQHVVEQLELRGGERECEVTQDPHDNPDGPDGDGGGCWSDSDDGGAGGGGGGGSGDDDDDASSDDDDA